MENKFTWNDLADAISKLTPEQRENQVHMSFDDESQFKSIAGIENVPNDIYIRNDFDTEDTGTLDDLKEKHGEYFKKEDYVLCTKKGHPFLWDGF